MTHAHDSNILISNGISNDKSSALAILILVRKTPDKPQLLQALQNGIVNSTSLEGICEQPKQYLNGKCGL